MAKRKLPPGFRRMPLTPANLRFDLMLADYEWLALKDLAAAVHWSKTKTIMIALAALSHEVLGYDLFALYGEQGKKGATPRWAATRRKASKV